MGQRDPFVRGLRIILAERPDLKPAPLGVAAGLDNSTLRKLLSDSKGIESLSVDKAEKVAKAAGYDLSTVIAIGEHSHGPEIIRLALAIANAPDEQRSQIDAYLEVSSFRPQTKTEAGEGLEGRASTAP